MAEPEKLTIRDAENAQKGILALALAYPDYPKLFKADNTTIRWNSIKADRSIGLFPIQGAVYLKSMSVAAMWHRCLFRYFISAHRLPTGRALKHRRC